MNKSLLLALAFLSFIFSCTTNEPLPRIGPYTSVENFLDQMDPEPQAFVLNMKVGGSFTTEKGTRIVVPSNGLVDKNGTLVNGEVDFTIKEVFSIKDMIYSNVLPVSGIFPLKSAGAFLLQAYQNDTALEIAPFAQIWATIPAQVSDFNMSLFIDDADEDTVNWNRIEGPRLISDSLQAYYSFPIPSGFNWYNVDVLIYYTPINVINPIFNFTEKEQLQGIDKRGYIIDVKNNSVQSLYVGSTNATGSALINDNYKILIMAIIDGTLHYGYRSIDGIEDREYDIAILPTTKENLDELLNSLP